MAGKNLVSLFAHLMIPTPIVKITQMIKNGKGRMPSLVVVSSGSTGSMVSSTQVVPLGSYPVGHSVTHSELKR